MAKFFDTGVEKKVLASILHDEDVLDHASGNITAADFENTDHAYLFDVIIRFYRKYYKCITPEILTTWLTKNIPEKKTQLMLLFSEISSLNTDEYSRYYINELKAYATKRRLYSIHERVTAGLNDDEDPDTLFTELSRAILTGGQSSLVYRTSVFDDFEGRIRLYQDKKAHPEKYKGVPYGIAEIDELTGGMYTGQLYMIMGRTGAGKCVAADTQLLMPDGGFRSISNIVKSRDSAKILTLGEGYKITSARPTNYMYSGKQKIYKLVTKSGRTINVTATHPLLSATGWKPLQDFRVGDRIAVPRTLPIFGNSTLPLEQVKLLAYLIAEGNLSTSSIGFTNYDPKIREDFCTTVKHSKISNISVTTHGNTLPREKRTLVIKGSVLTKDKVEYGKDKFRKLNVNPIKEWLRGFSLLGKKAVDKEIPPEIFRLSKDKMAKFLGILWSCDGSIYGKNLEHITFETGSPLLTQQVGHLLLRFGILTRYWEHFITHNGKKFKIGSIEVTGSCRSQFLEKIGIHFVGEKCKKVAHAKTLLQKLSLNTNVDTVPMSLIHPHLPKTRDGKIALKQINDKVKFTLNYSKNWNKYGICRNKVQALGKKLRNTCLLALGNCDIFWDSIARIEEGTEVDTYDLEMASTHNFIANDLIVHNSRMLFNIGCNVALAGKNVMYCTIEMEAAIIQHMWESRQLELPLQQILRAALPEPAEKRYVDFLKESDRSRLPFYIVDIPQGCTTGVIDAEVATFEKMHGSVPDVVLIDYANLISPVSRFKDRAEKYDHVFRELKEGARAHKTVYYTAAQMNRESLKSKEPGTEHVAFSDAASYHCDAVFRVYADKNMEENRELQFEVIKGRYHSKASVTLFWNREINLISSYGSVKLGSISANHYSGSAGFVQPGQPAPSAEQSVALSSTFEDY